MGPLGIVARGGQIVSDDFAVEAGWGQFKALPRPAADDAAHIAIAVTNGVDYLVTWNFRHIASAAIRA